ncbi:MAG: DUF389 domain-containing protein [Cyanobacteriota bacterium]|nr:DUF389 domain-containing protein [Cyanobacteriota bacterium]
MVAPPPPDADASPPETSRGPTPVNRENGKDRGQRLEALRREFERDAHFGSVFVVLTLGAALIATLGLLANSAAVVIGAMVVAPWILPLEAMAFEVLRGHLPSVLRALRTLLLGVALGVLVSVGVGWLVGLPTFGEEVMARTRPNLLDLAVALAAGGVAMFAKLRKEAISALAGLAIAVALVPPMCVVGLSLSAGLWQQAGGALLLFLTNLLGILSGAMVALSLLERPFRGRLLRSRLGLTSLAITALLVVPLGGSFLNLLATSRRQAQEKRIEELVRQSLRNETLTLGRDSKLENVVIQWDRDPPLIMASATVTSPDLPTQAQVGAVQTFINGRLAPRRFRLVVQRTAIEVVGPQEPGPAEP